MKRLCGLIVLMLPSAFAFAQQEAENQLDVSVSMLGHGEARLGGLDLSDGENDEGEDHAYFLMERTRLTIDYKRTGLETKITPQHSGIWGEKGKGSFNLFEAWVKLNTKNGLFAQLGRQALSYDDERIIGPNDWAMAGLTHDVLRLGYEGHGHKAHVILGFNQNPENMYGGTYYSNGSQPYKSMVTAWYHYDVPKIPLGASVLFMNIGMQGGEKGGKDFMAPKNRFQQLVGGYLCYNPGKLKTEASYYHQMGHNEDHIKIDAWMASVKAQWQFTPKASAFAGFDYLSGDKYFAVPAKGTIGLVRHKVIKGFNPVYGSHHKFYGMMDFFYVSTYINGFTPGLQNLYAGATFSPLKNLNLRTTYHYMSTATKLSSMDMTLGHDFDVEASYQIMKDVKFTAGFSYMTGTETMEKLKRAADNNNLKWGWFSLVVSPRIFTTKW